MRAGHSRSNLFAGLVGFGSAVLVVISWMLVPGTASTTRPVQATPLEPDRAHFHHVHLNVTDVAATRRYYEKFFGALPVRFRGLSDALFTERSFLLLQPVGTPPADNFGTTLWHIGWAGVHGPTEFEWREREGIEVQTPLTPLGREYYMYFWGPDRELVEVFTGSRNHRFEHVHLLATDIDATLGWFRSTFELEPNGGVRTLSGTNMRLSTIRIDNVNLIIFEVPRPGEEPAWLLPDQVGPDFAVTDGRAMDHIAFSYRDIRPVHERLVAAGLEIVRPITMDITTGFESFFVRGPDGLLVEVVEEAPLPEGVWR